MAEEIHDDPIYQAVCGINDDMESQIDIRPLAVAMVEAFASGQGDPEQFDGMVGLGKEAASLYKELKTESSRVRMMVEMMRLVSNCSEAKGDDLPDDRAQMEKTYRAAAAAAEAEAVGNHG